jgi:hypothetical protein
VDLRQLDSLRLRFEQHEDVGAADHRGFLAPCGRQCFGYGHGPLRPWRLPVAIAGEHDVAATGQGRIEAFEGLAAHDHRLAVGERLEVPQVRRNVPGQPAILADRAIGGAGIDEE